MNLTELQDLKDHELINLNASLEYLKYVYFRRRNYALQRKFQAEESSWNSMMGNECFLKRNDFDLRFSDEQITKCSNRGKNLFKLIREVEKEIERRNVF